MESSVRKWLKGCGCGCGVLLLLFGVVAWIGVATIGGLIEGVGRTEATMEKVLEAHGRVADYRPARDGSIPPDRMEAFLRVRELMAPARRETQAALDVLSSGGSHASEVPGLLGRLLAWGTSALKLEAGTRLAPQLIGFFEARGQALLEAGVGPGEYLYIYTVAYYCGLGKSPADGPSFVLVTDEEEQGRRGEHDAFDVREIRREFVLRTLNRQLGPMLRRQLEALEEEPGRPESDPWHQKLAAEVEALEKDAFRIPWRDGLPSAIEASVEPYRPRLEASYSPRCNPLEVHSGHGD